MKYKGPTGVRRVDFREKIIAWLVDEDHEVKVEPVPKEAPLEWVLKVTVKAPFKVNLLIQQPETKKDRIVVSMGIAIADAHKKALGKLSLTARTEIMTEIYRSLVTMCPDCIIIIQPNLSDPQGIAINRIIYHESLTREAVASTIRVMANSFAVIVSILNAKLGITPERRPERRTDVGFM